MKKGKCVAAANSKDQLLILIAKYFFSKPDSYMIKDDQLWFSAKSSKGERQIEGFFIKKKKDRFYFYRLLEEER